jgi:8-oxo-dGTP pyrophosphatase MutT (NUDIX family)
MKIDRPGPGEELNPGPKTTPRPAATVIVLRGGADQLEVLLVQRNPEARFMGGAWVFPGGAVDRAEGQGDRALRAAALRELEEEASIVLTEPTELVPFSRWITPAQVKTRFDTWFFLAPLPDGATPAVDGEEVVDLRWYAPTAALQACQQGELLLVFPTIKHLEQLSGFGSADELLEYARGQEIRPVQPRVLVSGETARVVLPGEPGYADAT